MEQPPEKMVSIHETLLLEFMWSYKDKCIVNPDDPRVAVLLPQLTIPHQEPDKETKLVAVWRRAEWKIHIDCYKKQKAESEARLAKNELRKELIIRLTTAFERKLGSMPANAQLAEQVVSSKNIIMAELAGLSVEDIELIKSL